MGTTQEHTTFRSCDCNTERPHGYFWKTAGSDEPDRRLPIMVPSLTAGSYLIETLVQNDEVPASEVPRLQAELAAAGLPEIAESEEADKAVIDVQLLQHIRATIRQHQQDPLMSILESLGALDGGDIAVVRV